MKIIVRAVLTRPLSQRCDLPPAVVEAALMLVAVTLLDWLSPMREDWGDRLLSLVFIAAIIGWQCVVHGKRYRTKPSQGGGV